MSDRLRNKCIVRDALMREWRRSVRQERLLRFGGITLLTIATVAGVFIALA